MDSESFSLMERESSQSCTSVETESSPYRSSIEEGSLLSSSLVKLVPSPIRLPGNRASFVPGNQLDSPMPQKVRADQKVSITAKKVKNNFETKFKQLKDWFKNIYIRKFKNNSNSTKTERKF